ncbi:tetratricopeptide repeat protein [Xanthobacter sp. V2C-8]|uniref:tetratricopeptide repeat protein n=1 Tax=Xanthobacter albus TaxID=3119929 RepID=UPI00372A251E
MPPPAAGAPARKPTMDEVHLALGQMCLDRGDRAHALDWFRAAARAGNACAFNMIGRCHDLGWGTAPDPAAAVPYFRRAAAMGDGWALFNLADLHARGRGVAHDDPVAYALYLEAARRGIGRAYNMLGLFHEAGRAVPADREKAADFFRAGGEIGDCWAAFNLGRLLLEDGARKAALPWLEQALETGFPHFHQAMAEAIGEQDDPALAALARRAAARAAGRRA